MERIPGIEAKRAKEEDIVKELDSQIQELEKAALEHASANAPSMDKKRELEHKLRDKRGELKQAQEEEKTVNDDIKALKEQINDHSRRIEQTRKEQATAISRRAETVDRVARLEEENERSKRQLAETRESYAQVEQKAEDCKNRQERSTETTTRLKTALDESRHQIRQMEAQKQNALKAFGPMIPEVLRDIDEVTKRRGWRGETPVGPLGRHVKLREEMWANVLESALGGVLNAFAVTEDADRSVLVSILKKHRW
jgi:chromosome segregation ATPase